MQVTYIGHSGFAVALERCTLLFDYYLGNIPAFAPGKPVYVFASHAHRDHFNFAIFDLWEKYPDVTYILSKDIRRKWSPGWLTRHGISQGAQGAVTFMGAKERLQFGEITVETLNSTDEGVAFIVTAEGKTIYHAGDLNDWTWDGEPEEENRAMQEAYRQEIGRLAGRRIDLAFLPLDPRQEGDFYRGFDYFMGHTDTVKAYPMHFWEDFGVFARLRALPCSEPYRDRIAGEGEYKTS